MDTLITTIGEHVTGHPQDSVWAVVVTLLALVVRHFERRKLLKRTRSAWSDK